MFLSQSCFKCKMRILITYLSRLLWDYQGKLLPHTVYFEGTHNKWSLLLLITTIFSEQNFYMYLATNIPQYPWNYANLRNRHSFREWKVDLQEWKDWTEIIRFYTRIWDLFSGVCKKFAVVSLKRIIQMSDDRKLNVISKYYRQQEVHPYFTGIWTNSSS